MDSTAVSPPALRVASHPIGDVSPLLPLLDARRPLVFLRRRQGLVGLGEALRLEFSGRSRVADAARAWRRIAAAAEVDDRVNRPGSGLIAFGAFTFSHDSADSSVLIVPSLVLGRRAGATWLTRIGTDRDLPAGTGLGAEPHVEFAPGALPPDGYRAAVAGAVRRIRAHGLNKVVLARDLVGRVAPDADLRHVLSRLATGYPDCHTFAVDGLLGASPETLVRVEAGTVSARVLAGSTARGVDEVADEEAAAALATSAKDLDEHEFAVQSVLAALRPHTRALVADEQPFTLKLPNLWHLATDVEGELRDAATALDLVATLHPTAAVAGSPTAAAQRLIAELEPFDRGRYAGPVGWVDARGDGEWAIALRGARVADDGTVTAHAGAGVVADSDPDGELAETRMKFRPVVEAFE